MPHYKVDVKNHALNGYTGELDYEIDGDPKMLVLKFPNGHIRGFTRHELVMVPHIELTIETKYKIALEGLKNCAMWKQELVNAEAENTLKKLNEII
jgi:hypothetical protein